MSELSVLWMRNGGSQYYKKYSAMAIYNKANSDITCIHVLFTQKYFISWVRFDKEEKGHFKQYRNRKKETCITKAEDGIKKL